MRSAFARAQHVPANGRVLPGSPKTTGVAGGVSPRRSGRTRKVEETLMLRSNSTGKVVQFWPLRIPRNGFSRKILVLFSIYLCATAATFPFFVNHVRECDARPLDLEARSPGVVARSAGRRSAARAPEVFAVCHAGSHLLAVRSLRRLPGGARTLKYM